MDDETWPIFMKFSKTRDGGHEHVDGSINRLVGAIRKSCAVAVPVPVHWRARRILSSRERAERSGRGFSRNN